MTHKQKIKDILFKENSDDRLFSNDYKYFDISENRFNRSLIYKVLR